MTLYHSHSCTITYCTPKRNYIELKTIDHDLNYFACTVYTGMHSLQAKIVAFLNKSYITKFALASINTYHTVPTIPKVLGLA